MEENGPHVRGFVARPGYEIVAVRIARDIFRVVKRVIIAKGYAVVRSSISTVDNSPISSYPARVGDLLASLGDQRERLCV